MKKKEFVRAVERMANAAGLRQVRSRFRPGSNWVGLCSGICVVMNLDSVRLQVDLSSLDQADNSGDVPEDDGESDVSEHSAEFDESPFLRATARGVPGSWFEQYHGELWGFQLVIDKERQRMLQPDALEGLLESITSDLHDLGAEEVQPCCECQREATTLGYFEGLSTGPSYVPYCGECWNLLQNTTSGTIQVSEPRSIRRGWAFLAASTLVFAVVWGWAQHPERGIPFGLLFVGCVGAGVATAMSTTWFAQGSNLGLRLGVALSVMLATLVGNIIGTKSLVKPAVTWTALVPTYFRWYFPAHVGQELLFLACGAIGVAIGFFLLRETERIRVR
jgi:hypothetical protein